MPPRYQMPARVARLEQQFTAMPAIIIVTEHASEWSAAHHPRRGNRGDHARRTRGRGCSRRSRLPKPDCCGSERKTRSPRRRRAGRLRTARRRCAQARCGRRMPGARGGTWWLAHRPPVARHAAGGTLSSGTAQLLLVPLAALRHAANTRSHVGRATGPARRGARGATDCLRPHRGVASGQGASAPRREPQTVLELLSSARVAFRDQKLLLPRPDGELHGDSALELYTQVLRQER